MTTRLPKTKQLIAETAWHHQGDMPDWNPAELIGILPSPLAASLYRLLITARTWQVARAAKAFSSTAAPVPLAWPGLHQAPAELS